MLLLALVPLTLADPVDDRLTPGATVVWAGLDYSRAVMYVPETFADPEARVFWGPGGGLSDRIARYAGPGDVWTQLTVDWNAMFLGDLLKRIEKDLVIDLVAELPEPDGQTAPRTAGWFRPEALGRDAARFTEAEIAAMVHGWKLTSTSGTGFGIVVERIAKVSDEACVWPVFFDVASRDMLSAERLCKAPGGMEFRNYWYNPIINAVQDVIKRRK
ncbi:MAG: hypothetical protein Q8P18_17735 [Pseudomonadota bacterium]|nr:hypothetical protein [Pseudomonadota bacterium]